MAEDILNSKKIKGKRDELNSKSVDIHIYCLRDEWQPWPLHASTKHILFYFILFFGMIRLAQFGPHIDKLSTEA